MTAIARGVKGHSSLPYTALPVEVPVIQHLFPIFQLIPIYEVLAYFMIDRAPNLLVSVGLTQARPN